MRPPNLPPEFNELLEKLMKRHGFKFQPKNKFEEISFKTKRAVKLNFYSLRRSFLDPIEYLYNYLKSITGISTRACSYEEDPENLWRDILSNRYAVSGNFITKFLFTRQKIRIRKTIIEHLWVNSPEEYSLDEIHSFWDSSTVEDLSSKDPNFKRFLLLLNLLKKVPTKKDPLQMDMEDLFPLIGLIGGPLRGFAHNLNNYPKNIYITTPSIEREVIKKLGFRGSKLNIRSFILNYIIHDLSPLLNTSLKNHVENRRFNKFIGNN